MLVRKQILCCWELRWMIWRRPPRSFFLVHDVIYINKHVCMYDFGKKLTNHSLYFGSMMLPSFVFHTFGLSWYHIGRLVSWYLLFDLQFHLQHACFFDRRVFVGDVVVLKDPQKSDNYLVRRLAATEGYEMVSKDEKDEPFVLEKDECWVLADNENTKPKVDRTFLFSNSIIIFR